MCVPQGVRSTKARPSAVLTTAPAATSAAASPRALTRNARTPGGSACSSCAPNASSMLITALRSPGHANSFAFAAP